MRFTSAIVFAAAALLCGCIYGDDNSSANTTHFQQRAKPGQAVALDVDGSIGVELLLTASPDGFVRLDATPLHGLSGLRLTQAADAQWLRLRLDPPSGQGQPMHWPFGRGREAKITLSVPPDATVSVNAVNGPVHADGVHGPLAIHLVNGPIEVAGAGNVLSLHLVNGPISVAIEDQSRTPNINIAGTNGSIEVIVPKGFRAMVDAHTVLGPLDERLSNTQGPGSMSVRLVAGPVTIEER